MSGMHGAQAQPWRRARGGGAAAQRGKSRPGGNIAGASARGAAMPPRAFGKKDTRLYLVVLMLLPR
jgi:hypothetical protein